MLIHNFKFKGDYFILIDYFSIQVYQVFTKKFYNFYFDFINSMILVQANLYKYYKTN